MVKENKVKNYILYAIGEIFLVMIGILLALQVNNWNEGRKLRSNINNSLKAISFDLETDTTAAARVIKFYEDNQKNSKKVITGEITKENISECLQCLNLVTIYQPFNIQNKAFEQFKTLTDSQNEKDSLIADVVKFYSAFKPLISKNNDRMEDVVMSNFRDFEKFPWFMDMAQNKISPEMITYFTESDDYKRRVASHAMLAVVNHLTITKQYKSQAGILLERIEKRLEK